MKSKAIRATYRLLATIATPLVLACASEPTWPKALQCADVVNAGAEVLQILLAGGGKSELVDVAKRRGEDAALCGTQWAIDELSKPGLSPESVAARKRAEAFLAETGTEIR